MSFFALFLICALFILAGVALIFYGLSKEREQVSEETEEVGEMTKLKGKEVVQATTIQEHLKKIQEPSGIISKLVTSVTTKLGVEQEIKAMKQHVRYNEAINEGLRSEIEIHKSKGELGIVKSPELVAEKFKTATLEEKATQAELEAKIREAEQKGQSSKKSKAESGLEELERKLDYKRKTDQIRKLHELKSRFEMSQIICDFYDGKMKQALRGRDYSELKKEEQQQINDLQDQCLAELDKLE